MITKIQQTPHCYLVSFQGSAGVNIKMLPLSTDLDRLKGEFGYEEEMSNDGQNKVS